MMFLLVLALFQAPEDMAGFLESLEKDRAKGATNEQLLQKIEGYLSDQPAAASRLAWNLQLLKATIRIDALLADGLKKRVGQPVTLGKASGVVKEVKADRVILTSGEVLFSTIPIDARLDDVKRQSLLPAKSPEEAVLRFAAGKSVAALAPARAVEAKEQPAVFAAIAGWVIQDASAAPFPKSAEDLAATWAKQPELLPHLQAFLDSELAPRLVAEVDALVETDRKQARKLLDLAGSLAKLEGMKGKIAERKWAVLEKGEWMPVSLENVMYEGGTLKGRAIAWEDPVKDAGKMRGLRITGIPVSWDEISGIRCRIKPVKADVFDMRLRFSEDLSIALAANQGTGYGYLVRYEKDGGGGVEKGSMRKLTKKGELEFMVQWEDKKWKFSISGVEIDNVKLEGMADQIEYLTDNGSAELVTLQFRRK